MILFLIILTASFSLTFLVKVITKKKLLDIPNERSSHVTPTPRGGGLAIAISWFAGIIYLKITGNIDENLFYALISGVLISSISFLDDIYTLKSLPRIIIHVISTIIALYFIGGLNKIDLGFFSIENKIILNILAFVGIIWFINLFNFIDGIDGHSSSGALFISLALFFFIKDTVLLTLAASVLGFLPWNWQKAKIFMGDIGSTLLGFTIAVLLIYYNNNEQFSIVNGLIITAVFWFDATFTLIRRFLNKENIGQAHRKHAYQRIVQYGFSHQKTVLLVAFINLLLFSLVYFSIYMEINNIALLTMTILLLFSIYKLVDNKTPFKVD
ncbi:MAG: glycosyltransferase family 4 protein [Flavobacteriales bacterium]|nr:glycosyltransferase family 4 protein [Flavobacteriales bacterium]